MSFVKLDISELEFFEKLGGGASGSVYRARWKTRDKIVAAKKMLAMDKEPEVLSSLSHRNIVQFFGAATKSPDFCLITEYAELGSLYDFLRKNSLEYSQILLWAKQIAMGMNYLHYEAPIPVIHRDLKSKNVVIAMDLTAKICDFGSSKFHSHTTKMTLVGTFPWMAPEIIQQLPATPACDVYSYSVVLWELLTDEIPFAGLEGMQVAWLVVAKNQRLLIPDSCPSSFSDLMKKCWETEPNKRPTFKQILDNLENMLENENLKEETDVFLRDKSIWKSDIEIELKKLSLAHKDLSVKQKELDTREQMLKERENEFVKQRLQQRMSTVGLPREDVQAHDVSSWSEEDVANWVFHVNEELSSYSDLFVKNNISGRRLFLLTGDDLLQIGVLSVGHRKELLDEIGHLKNDNYRLLHFPPLPNTPTICPSRPLSLTGKEETLTVLFGSLYRRQGDSYRWKMIIDFEGSQSVTSSIREVVFVCSQAVNGEKQTLHTPPFITGSWIKKSIDEPIEVTVKYKDGIVCNPQQSTLTFHLTDSHEVMEQSVKLEMVKRERNPSGAGAGSHNTSSESLMTLSPSTSVHRLSGVWLDRNHLLSVPSSESVDSSTIKWTVSPFSPDAPNTVTSSVSSINEPSLSKDSDAVNNSLLQGAWGSSKMTAAAMIKKNIGSSVLPPRSTTPSSGSRRSSSGESDLSNTRHAGDPSMRLSSSCGSNSDMWKSKQSDRGGNYGNQEYGRSQSSGRGYYRSDSRRGDQQSRGRGARRTDGGGYYRSVSDVSGAQQQQRQRGGGTGGRRGRKQPYSEPHNKRN